MKGKYKIPKDIEERIINIKKLGFKLSDSYENFLRTKNVVAFKNKFFIKSDKIDLPIEFILGFSKNKDEDLIYKNKMYENRIPNSYLAIASVNYGDLLCLSPSGEIFHWDHEIHDLYFSNDGSGYKPQNINLNRLAASFQDLEKNIVEAQSFIDDEEDEFDSAQDENLPYMDSELDIYFSSPKIFFLNPPKLIEIYLKRMNLSERGRKLLEKFKQEGLM